MQWIPFKTSKIWFACFFFCFVFLVLNFSSVGFSTRPTCSAAMWGLQRNWRCSEAWMGLFLFVCFKWALVQVTKTLWRTFDEVFRTIHIKLYQLHLFLRLDVLEMSQHSVWFEIVFQSSRAPTQHSTSFWINKFCAVTNFFRITFRPSNANHFIWAALLKRQWR